MKSFAVLFIIATIPIARGQEKCTFRVGSSVETRYEPPKYALTLGNEYCSVIGELKYCKFESGTSQVSGVLPGLQAGAYVGIMHKYGNFNGSCSTVGPIARTQKRCAFPRTVLKGSENKVPDSWVYDTFFEDDPRRHRKGRLVVVYSAPLSCNFDWCDGTASNAELETDLYPVACGIIKRTFQLPEPPSWYQYENWEED